MAVTASESWDAEEVGIRRPQLCLTLPCSIMMLNKEEDMRDRVSENVPDCIVLTLLSSRYTVGAKGGTASCLAAAEHYWNQKDVQ